MDEGLIPTWGYHHKGGPKLFNLRAGESLPKGYSDRPYPPKLDKGKTETGEQENEENDAENDA